MPGLHFWSTKIRTYPKICNWSISENASHTYDI